MAYNEKMFALGSKRSIIREIFEYSKTRAQEIGADKVFDFKTGKEISVVAGKGKISVIPGGGVIIFAGTEDEFNKIYSSVK